MALWALGALPESEHSTNAAPVLSGHCIAKENEPVPVLVLAGVRPTVSASVFPATRVRDVAPVATTAPPEFCADTETVTAPGVMPAIVQVSVSAVEFPVKAPPGEVTVTVIDVIPRSAAGTTVRAAVAAVENETVMLPLPPNGATQETSARMTGSRVRGEAVLIFFMAAHLW